MEPLSPLQEIGREIAAEQDRCLAEQDLAPLRKYFVAHVLGMPEKPRRPRSVYWAIAATFGVAASIAAAIGLKGGTPLTYQIDNGGTLATEESWIKAPADHALDIHFSDGSDVELAAGARGRVLGTGPHGAEVLVEHGAADVSVVPRRNAAWRVISGPYAIQVTGTRFRVEFAADTEQLTVSLFEGSIHVTGCALGSGTRLIAGQTLRASCRESKFEVRPNNRAPQENSASSASSAAKEEAVSAPTSEATNPKISSLKKAAVSTPDWRQFAASGRYVEAFNLVQAVFETECSQASAPDLLMLGNAARLAGAPSKAQFAYSTVRSRFRSDSAAALAAFHLARMAFDQAHDYARAAEWFRSYLREQPQGALAQEALGRLMEALDHTGDRSGAERAARSYLERYPQGMHAAFAKRLMR